MPLLSRFSRVTAPVALAALCAAQAQAQPAGVTFRHVRRAGMRASVISVNLNDPNVKVSVALPRRGVGSRESFGALLHRVRPTAAITGTYFGLQDSLPVGDIVVGGRLIHSGFIGTALAVTPNNRVRFVETRRGKSRDWSDFETVICGGPRLVTAGRTLVVPRAEGFRDRSLFRRRPRTAVGVTYRNRLVLVTVARPIYLRQLARLMRSLGCRDAIALDGGSSSAMFYRGRFAARPHRSLTNLLVVYDSSAGYHRALGRLAPGLTLAQRPQPSHSWAVAGSRSTSSSPDAPADPGRSADRHNGSDDGDQTD